MREKVQSSVDFLVTQMFSDNRSMYSFMDRAAQKGISVSLTTGIMPVISSKSIRRMVDLSGTSLTVTKTLDWAKTLSPRQSASVQVTLEFKDNTSNVTGVTVT